MHMKANLLPRAICACITITHVYDWRCYRSPISTRCINLGNSRPGGKDMRIFFGTAFVLVCLIANPAFAQVPSPPETADLQRIGDVLLLFLVLSVVFEVALTPVFNSRFYLAYLDGQGLKIPITIALALLVFWAYDLDIIRDTLNALEQKDAFGKRISLSFGGQILTALLIAGGSDGIFRIFSKLGIRNPAERKIKAAEAKRNLEVKRATAE